MDSLGVEKFHVLGTSYGGFVAYRMAEMCAENVEKVVIASSAVNMRKENNEELVQRAERIEEALLPTTAAEFRTLMGLASSWRLDILPDYFLNDVVNVSFFAFYWFIYEFYLFTLLHLLLILFGSKHCPKAFSSSESEFILQMVICHSLIVNRKWNCYIVITMFELKLQTLFLENRKEKTELLKGITLGLDNTSTITPLNKVN